MTVSKPAAIFLVAFVFASLQPFMLCTGDVAWQRSGKGPNAC